MSAAGCCVICGTAGPVQQHHVARAENLSITVPLCLTCHRRVWDHESTAGVHRPTGTDTARAWAVLHGFLALGAVAAGRWTSELAGTRGALLALLCSLTDQPVGPNPVTAATRRPAHDADAPGDADAQTRFSRELLTTMSAAVSEWLGDDELAGIAARLATADRLDTRDIEAARRLTAEAAAIAGRLAEPDDTSICSGELGRRLCSFDIGTRDLLRRMTT